MSGSSDDGPLCPVCKEHTVQDSLASQQVALRGIRALFEQDDKMIRDVYSVLTPYDGHTAIAIAAMFLGDLASACGLPVDVILAQYGRNLSAAQTSTDQA